MLTQWRLCAKAACWSPATQVWTDRAPASETLTVDYEADASGAPEMATRRGPGSKGSTSSAWEKLSGTDVTSSGKERQDFAKGRLFQAKAAERAKAWGVKKTNPISGKAEKVAKGAEYGREDRRRLQTLEL